MQQRISDLTEKEGVDKMIFDSIKNAGIYEGISPNLKTALEYMRSHDLNAMKPGRYPIEIGRASCRERV